MHTSSNVMAVALCLVLIGAMPARGDEPPDTPSKLRVLYVEHLPRWEYRALSSLLVNDRSIAASIYLYSADPDFEQPASEGVEPLNEPPAAEALAEFDVIILGDLPGDVLRANQDGLIAAIVEQVTRRGAGLIVLAASDAFECDVLASVLPVQPRGPAGDATDRPPPSEPFRVRLTNAGRDAAAIRLADDADASARLWEQTLPEFVHCLPEVRLAAKAIALANHPVEGGGEAPVIATIRRGAGRCVYLGTDEFWRWRRHPGTRPHARFWLTLIRHHARPPISPD